MISARILEESGILLVDKPVSWTSHDVVNCVRRRFNVGKVGHCGTLDPNATGLLVLVLGQATRLSEKLSGQEKAYAGTMRLGIETFSEDSDGEVTATHDTAGVTPEAVQETARRFVGEIQQIPPMVSAIKKEGRPLYKMARKGIVIEREARPVTIRELIIDRIAIPDVDFHVTCTKGTYVRTLCADMGRVLGCGAHLLNLRRLHSGKFDIAGAVTLDVIKSWERTDLLAHMIPLAQVFPYIT